MRDAKPQRDTFGGVGGTGASSPTSTPTGHALLQERTCPVLGDISYQKSPRDPNALPWLGNPFLCALPNLRVPNCFLSESIPIYPISFSCLLVPNSYLRWDQPVSSQEELGSACRQESPSEARQAPNLLIFKCRSITVTPNWEVTTLGEGSLMQRHGLPPPAQGAGTFCSWFHRGQAASPCCRVHVQLAAHNTVCMCQAPIHTLLGTKVHGRSSS